MSEAPRAIYEFGPYRLDLRKRLLLRDQEAVPLTPKSFDTLHALVESGGRILGKEELITRVWPDTFVEEGNLTVNISMLRKALGESPNEHRYIVTVPGRGYRFVPSVREISDGNDIVHREHIALEEVSHSKITIQETEGSEITDTRSTRTVAVAPTLSLAKPFRVLIAAIVAIAVLVAAVFAVRFVRRPERRSDWRSSLRLMRVLGEKGDRKESMNSGRLSPDGRMIIYSSTGEGLNLWLKQVEGGQPLQITHGSWHDDTPIWSPNGQIIAFMSDRDNQVGIWTIPFLGGSSPTLLKVIEPTTAEMKGTTALLRWSNSQQVIYYSWQSNVYALDVTAREATQITAFDPKTPFSRDFSVSADDEWLAYVDRIGKHYDVWRIPMKGGAQIRVTDDNAIDLNPVWHPDGTRILYSSKRDGRFRLFVAYLDGHPPEQLTFQEEEGYLWDISSDGTRLLYYGKRDESSLWRVDVKSGTETQLSTDIGLKFWPQVSPLGGEIAFQANPQERVVWEPKKSALMVKKTDPEGQGFQLAAEAFAAQWSPNGKMMGFLRSAETAYDLFTIGTSGGEERRQATQVHFGNSTIGPPFNKFYSRDFSWSPDSTKIAYCSDRDGPPNLWTVSVEDSLQIRISTNADRQVLTGSPSWSPDGTRIGYVANSIQSPDEGKQSWTLWVTDLQKCNSILQTDKILRLLGWTADSRELILASVENSGMNRSSPAEVSLSRITLPDGLPIEIGRINGAYFSNIHLSFDARNVSLVAAYHDRDDIWILPVEGGQPKKITSNPDRRLFYSGLAWSPDDREIYYSKQGTWSLMTIIDNFR